MRTQESKTCTTEAVQREGRRSPRFSKLSTQDFSSSSSYLSQHSLNVKKVTQKNAVRNEKTTSFHPRPHLWAHTEYPSTSQGCLGNILRIEEFMRV